MAKEPELDDLLIKASLLAGIIFLLGLLFGYATGLIRMHPETPIFGLGKLFGTIVF